MLSGPVLIKGVIDDVIKKWQPAQDREWEIILKNWRKVIGWRQSRHCHPLFIKSGRLTVGVDSSGWLFELTMRKEQILKKINKLKTCQIKDIVFKIGRFE
jgi:predicted nucleic acid-binding Zn ribbon protein